MYWESRWRYMQPLIPAVGAALSSGKGPIIGYKEGDFGAYCGNLTELHNMSCWLYYACERDAQHQVSALRCRRANQQPNFWDTVIQEDMLMSPEEYRFKCGQLTQDKRRLSHKLFAVTQHVSDLEMALLHWVIFMEGEHLSPQQNKIMNSLVEDSVSEFESIPPEFIPVLLLGRTDALQSF